MQKNLFFLLLILVNISIFSQCPIVPNPNEYKQLEGNLILEKSYSILGEQISTDLRKHLNVLLKNNFELVENKKSSTKILFIKNQSKFKHEAYAIEVKKNKIQISYGDDAGCFYAINSIVQLISDKDGKLQIYNCTIFDEPKFKWRGLHLDVSRHFFTVREIKRFLDLMSFYKFNNFHWHLTDDQGWRIEIKKYPKLTEIGAWRDSTLNDHYGTIPRTYNKERYGGFYTTNDIAEVVAYAVALHINVVPEIEMPGHARAALAAYPEFSCTGEQQNVPGLWGVFDDIYCSKKESIDFNISVLEEILPLFPSKYIHIGGDEAPKERWKKCAACQKVISDNNLKDENELQSYFIKKIDAYLISKNKTLIGWDEILEGGLSPNAAVMSWRGTEGGIEAATQGHEVVMSPGSHCYFDHYQSKDKNEPLAIGGFTDLEKVFSFNPIPDSLEKSKHHLILGAQANLWTEYIQDYKKLEYMAFPRALALSEVLWSKNKLNYTDFLKKVNESQTLFLDKMKVNYSKSNL